MAGTDRDDITSVDWPLAGAELAFVVKLVGPEQRANDRLLDGLDDGSIRWR